VEIGDIKKLHNAPPEVAGVVSVHGRPHVALYLNELFGLKPLARPATLLTVDYRNVSLGLLIEKVVTIRTFALDESFRVAAPEKEFAGYVKDERGEMIGLLNMAGLIREERLARYRGYVVDRDLKAGQEPGPVDSVALLTFQVGEESYALPLERIEKVVEELVEVAAPPVFKSLTAAVQVRGQVMPALDLRVFTGAPARTTDYTAYLIVTEQERRWALKVDRVNRVLNLPRTDIENARRLDASEDMVTGVARFGAALVSILDLGKLIDQACRDVG